MLVSIKGLEVSKPSVLDLSMFCFAHKTSGSKEMKKSLSIFLCAQAMVLENIVFLPLSASGNGNYGVPFITGVHSIDK